MTASSAAEPGLDRLRQDVDELNGQILALLQERAAVVMEISRCKQAQGLKAYDPQRETAMLAALATAAAGAGGPLGPEEVRTVFKAIFQASLDLQVREKEAVERAKRRALLAGRAAGAAGVRVGDVVVGAGRPVLFAGPCSVETPEQMEEVVAFLAALPGPKILRAGAFKPRTSPYSFQGLREEGLTILRQAADRHGLAVVTEVLDAAGIEVVAPYADMLQVGARNMYNTELLKALGRTGKPVLLKRGFMATLEELLLAAEYVLAAGNAEVVLCERGIRTFETWTRNTLDIAAVPLLQREAGLPVIVDLSHALGRKDILLPCGRAALAAGADGLMVEVHPRPEQALSDASQQLDLDSFQHFLAGLGWAGSTEALS